MHSLFSAYTTICQERERERSFDTQHMLISLACLALPFMILQSNSDKHDFLSNFLFSRLHNNIISINHFYILFIISNSSLLNLCVF